MISSHVAIVGNDHPFDASDRTIQEFPSSPPATVVLEGDNLIGYGTIILGPVTIGRGTVVGAGSLVTHDLPRDVVAYGRPAVAKRSRRGHL
jgi:acetyltransferase-like isoleucine patch superfamily enzyme